MKLNELAKVCNNCGLHIIDITKYPGVDCGSVNANYFDEVSDVEKYKNYNVVNIYTNEMNDPNLLRVEIKEK